jgi:hypothetical protein
VKQFEIMQRHPRDQRGSRECAEVSEGAVAELVSTVLSSLPRRDQRRHATQYLHGLLAADGRKSIRNIAKLVGGRATEQSLHHFVSSSTWDWTAMREQLAGLLQGSRPDAWVVQSLPIPKKGEHSVGVERRLIPELGQTLNGQRAFGVWSASERMSAPMNWRLYLPETWVDDAGKRSKAEIPHDIDKETLEECAAAAVLELVQGWELTPHPVLLDARAPGLRRLVPRFADMGIPLLARINGSARLTVADDELLGHARGAFPARRILESVKRLASPVAHVEPAEGVSPQALLATVRVRLPGTGMGVRQRAVPDRQLRLVGIWHGSEPRPATVWLTNLATSANNLLRLTTLPGRVAHDFVEVGDQVGLRDFEGRSYPGWHRHMTMASVAHTASVLGRTGRPATPSYGPSDQMKPQGPEHRDADATGAESASFTVIDGPPGFPAPT